MDMRILGLTGGIGMGKSAAADWFRGRAISVVDSDVLAREVVAPGQPALAEIARTFGAAMLDSSGRLDREEMARVVFGDPEARHQLEAITHPRIRALWKTQLETWRAAGHPVAVAVVPLLFEVNAQKEFSVTICLACSAWTQRRRLLARGWTPEQIEQRVRAQWPIEKKIDLADYVVWTEGGLDVLAAQLERILPTDSPTSP